MAKILYVGIFKDHCLGGDIILRKGFIENNQTVISFDHRSIAAEFGVDIMNEMLIKATQNVDVLFIGMGDLIALKTLETISKRDITISLWYGDIRREIPAFVTELLPFVDYYFMTSGGKILKKYFDFCKPKHASFFINPFDSSYLVDANILRNNRVVFSGTKYRFAGEFRKNCIKLLENNSLVDLYGKPNANTFESKLKNFIKYPKKWNYQVRGEAYIKVLSKYSMGVGINAFNEIDKYFSDCVIHYMGLGLCMLQSYSPKLETIFKIDEEILTYSNIDELNSKLALVNNDGDYVKEIAIRGQKKISSEYNSKQITKYMLDIIMNNNCNMFEWGELLL